MLKSKHLTRYVNPHRQRSRNRNTGMCSPDGRLLKYLENRIITRRIVEKLQARGHDTEILIPEENDISLTKLCRRVKDWCRPMGGGILIQTDPTSKLLAKPHHHLPRPQIHQCRTRSSRALGYVRAVRSRRYW